MWWRARRGGGGRGGSRASGGVWMPDRAVVGAGTRFGGDDEVEDALEDLLGHGRERGGHRVQSGVGMLRCENEGLRRDGGEAGVYKEREAECVQKGKHEY